jgi:PAS domain S-box-containing protein
MIEIRYVLLGLALVAGLGLAALVLYLRRRRDWRRRYGRLVLEVEARAETTVQLQQLAAHLQQRADTAPSALWEWNVRTGEIRLAGRFLELTGYPGEELPQRVEEVLALVHPDDRPRLETVFRDYLERRTADCVTEFRLRGADGRYLWILARANATWDDEDRPERVVGSFTDITGRVEAEEQRVRLFNLSIDMLAVIDFDQYVQQLNPAWVRVLGWSRDDLMARPLGEFALAEDREVMAEAFTQLQAGEPLEGIACRFECRDGSWRWLAFTAFPYPDRKTVFAVARDITVQKETEEQQAVYQERLRQLRNQLSVVEDRERQELAAAIHDGLAQQLFGLRAQITLLKYPDRLADYEGVVATALEVLDQTMVAARSLSFELFPPVLYQVGLEGALQWLTHHYEERTGQTCRFTLAGAGPELPQDTRAMAYQSVRELLNNVRKHATASRVDVTLDWRNGETVIEVGDDGCGFVPADRERLADDPVEGGGFGLFSIGERIRSVSGTFRIDSAPGQGTRAQLRIPDAEERPAAVGD